MGLLSNVSLAKLAAEVTKEASETRSISAIKEALAALQERKKEDLVLFTQYYLDTTGSYKTLILGSDEGHVVYFDELRTTDSGITLGSKHWPELASELTEESGSCQIEGRVKKIDGIDRLMDGWSFVQSSVDYSSLTKKELQNLAEEAGLEYGKSATKADLITLLQK